jgi:chromosome segregation ATPase
VINLDLRWNHAGLVGGRALLDLLKWNRSIIELELAGNEVPEDILKAIAAAIDRNRDRWHHDLHTKAHAETMASTIQSLTQSHKESMNEIEMKYSREMKDRELLNGKLSLATAEIENMHEAYRLSQTRVERLEEQLKQDQESITKERADMQKFLNDLQRELQQERDTRMRLEDKHQKYFSDSTEKTLELQSNLKRLALDLEVLKKDKEALLHDLNSAKEKERSINQLWEGKII